MTDLIQRDERFGSVVFKLDSPHNRNALSKQLVGELQAGLDAAAADPEVRAVVLTGEGQVFCAGADLSDPPVSTGRGSFADVLRTIYEFPKPVLTAINGHVRAGGFGLVALGDVVLCAASATFAFTEVRIGVAPAIIAVPCIRRMTPLAVARYFLTGETFGASDAVAAGLVSEVVPDDELEAATDKVLDAFRLCEPAALANTRAVLRDVPTMPVDVGFSYTQQFSERQFQTPIAAEGIAAFKEKRQPKWVK